MKKMDDMSKDIRLRFKEVSFKFLLLTLSTWTLFECYSSIFKSENYNSIPVLLLFGAVSIQNFYEIYLKRKMIVGDEEYSEPNKFLLSIVLLITISAIIISVGYFISRM